MAKLELRASHFKGEDHLALRHEQSFEVASLSEDANWAVIRLQRLKHSNLTRSTKHLVYFSCVLLLGMHHLPGVLLQHH